MAHKVSKSSGDSTKDPKVKKASQHSDSRKAGGGGRKPRDMGSSVTPHVEISPEYRLLSCGVDSLDVSAYVYWDTLLSLMDSLEEGKNKASSLNKPTLWRKTSLGSCLIYPTGKPPMYRFHLQIREMHLFIGIGQRSESYPNVYISFNSKALWRDGIEENCSFARQLIIELGGRIDNFKPSRVDLCADYHIPNGLDFDFLKGLGVPENIKLATIAFGAKLETYYIGSKGASIRARIYDKAKEVVEHRKLWFMQIWGISECNDVWRIEFQLRRQALKDYGINTIQSLCDNLGGIWSDLSNNWYSLRLRNNKNTSRRDFHPWWLDVQKVAEKLGPITSIKRNLKRGNKADREYYLKRAANCLLGFAAVSGLPDIQQALNEFDDAIYTQWNIRDWPESYAIKSVEVDGPFTEEDYDDEIPF